MVHKIFTVVQHFDVIHWHFSLVAGNGSIVALGASNIFESYYIFTLLTFAVVQHFDVIHHHMNVFAENGSIVTLGASNIFESC